MPDNPKAATFTDLYTAYAKDVYRFSLYLSGDASRAQDLTAETFLRVWVTDQPVQLSSVKAWLFVIARNLYRHELRHIRRSLPLDQDFISTESLEEGAESRQQLEHVSRALALLPEPDRAAVLLRVEGLSYREIAALLQISVAAAKVKVHRARAVLAKQNSGGIGHEHFEKHHS